ncbi:YggS family pyridoxal phosphate-dependent enzyme [Deinococcus maricopensis]|uniref:Alanine racemase N-terminal domain-containing protein n=1 Tax=Deinococcus maricopensis (strain DSM 21211 / LMG 22137 / NRRL B-23946 / LB-34) TaxID=709986 RepID=E8U876_DEIML|nr:YggS family pyridoxal phosphate-dependent enzyme [Deinococcus maricopensis]ADV67265.1 protein of unknown function UPF0001 [Deinococcus maricopensis DSM 21211]
MSVPDVLRGLRAAEEAAGRAPGSARLVAITKGHSVEEITEHVLQHGTFPLGENRGQELRDKARALPGQDWHFIGPLQRNKIKYLAPVTLVHTLEVAWQAEEIARHAEAWGRAPDVLLQVSNGERQKHGVSAENLRALYDQVRQTGLNVRGLMVMAPYDDPAAARAVFADTQARAHDLGLSELSMGMSDDYPEAVRYGATLVRVGRALFQ